MPSQPLVPPIVGLLRRKQTPFPPSSRDLRWGFCGAFGLHAKYRASHAGLPHFPACGTGEVNWGQNDGKMVLTRALDR